MRRKVDEKGLTLIPIKFYLKRGLVKVELGICRGKKTFDKRQEIMRKDLKRETERALRQKTW
ncbi:SsrA-binding protein [subsurface metagenome]